VVRRRALKAGLDKEPSLHSFRRAFAIGALRGGVDLMSLQRLLGHADLSVIRRYLAQTEDDLQAAHRKGSPVDNLL
jgi:integrase/recombinase XerD